MLVLGLSGAFMIAALGYAILALQLYMGFPPLYRNLDLFLPWKLLANQQIERELLLILPFVGVMMALVFSSILVRSPLLFAVTGILLTWGGLRVRRHLRQTIGEPLPWLTNIWWMPIRINIAILKWPMLVFDIWTLSFSLVFFLIFGGLFLG